MRTDIGATQQLDRDLNSEKENIVNIDTRVHNLSGMCSNNNTKYRAHSKFRNDESKNNGSTGQVAGCGGQIFQRRVLATAINIQEAKGKVYKVCR